LQLWGESKEYMYIRLVWETIDHQISITVFAESRDPNGLEKSSAPENLFFKWAKFASGKQGNKVFVYNPTPRLTRHLVGNDCVAFWKSLFSEHGLRDVKAAYASQKKVELWEGDSERMTLRGADVILKQKGPEMEK
jgi:hypothetical protein